MLLQHYDSIITAFVVKDFCTVFFVYSIVVALLQHLKIAMYLHGCLKMMLLCCNNDAIMLFYSVFSFNFCNICILRKILS